MTGSSPTPAAPPPGSRRGAPAAGETPPVASAVATALCAAFALAAWVLGGGPREVVFYALAYAAGGARATAMALAALARLRAGRGPAHGPRRRGRRHPRRLGRRGRPAYSTSLYAMSSDGASSLTSIFVPTPKASIGASAATSSATS